MPRLLSVFTGQPRYEQGSCLIPTILVSLGGSLCSYPILLIPCGLASSATLTQALARCSLLRYDPNYPHEGLSVVIHRARYSWMALLARNRTRRWLVPKPIR